MVYKNKTEARGKNKKATKILNYLNKSTENIVG